MTQLAGRPRRITRRMFLTDLGVAGLGVIVVGACGSDSAGDDAAPSTDAPAASPTDSSPLADDGAGGGAALQLQHVSLGFVSAYVLLRGNEAAVVDTGTPGSAALILGGLDALGASWSDVAHVVLTHNHGDHVGGLREVLDEAPGATVYAGEADLDTIFTTSAPLQAIGDGDEVLGMGVLNTPGHTPGSISLFDTETGILVAGDAINGDGGRLTGANPSFSNDLTLATASIGKMAALGPRVAAFGHGGAPISDDVTAQLEALAAAG